MSRDESLLPADVAADLTGLELSARGIVEGFLSGLHRSPFRGFSVEFAEHREYVPGDDLRYVDWKVFGRSDRIYLKQFEEDTNFTCHLVLDTSGSMGYRSSRAALSKFAYARQLAAALSYLVLGQQDAIALATFGTELGPALRPSTRMTQFRQLCELLDPMVPAGETAMGPLLHQLAERIRQRGVVIILSDCFDDLEGILGGLKHFRYRRQDVLLLVIADPAEQDFPFDDPTQFEGLEQPLIERTDPRLLRAAYQREYAEFHDALRLATRELRLDYEFVRTDESPAAVLTRLLTQRQRAAR